MVKHILVPLDGTSLAESALPEAKTLARLCAAQVTLLHVIEPDPGPLVHGERHLTNRPEAESYLTQIARQFSAIGIPCRIHVHSDAVQEVADGIVAHEEELCPDLIVMCTHGPGKIDRLLRGSLAQRVVALGTTPLLLTSPENRAAGRTFSLQNILIALDGDARHEKGFALACYLAEISQAKLQLLSVVPELASLAGRNASLSRFLPGATWFLQRMAQENLRSYLGRLLAQAEEMSINAAGEVRYGKVTRTICERAEASDSDLIVLATHGKAGTKAFWANSIADQVQGQTLRSLLLVPV